MRRILSLLLIALAVAACRQDADAPLGPAAPQAPVLALQPGAERVPGQYIVVFHDDVRDVPGLARRMAAAHGGTIRYVYEHALKGFSLQLPDAAIHALARNPAVKYVEPNQRMYLAATQSSPPWGLDRVDQRDRPLNGAYNYTYTGSGVRAYIIDTGVRISHGDFGGRASNGWDFIENDGVAQDCHGHGTHVAGTVGGATYGVAKGVSIVALRVFDCAGSTYNDAVTKAVDWVRYNAVKPAVANMSLRGPASTTLDNAVRSAISAGVVFVVAAGNDSQPACNVSPARVGEAITVGASDINDREASFSNYGSCVDLFAPGVNVQSASHANDTDGRPDSGTSMASPHVAGAAALYLQYQSAATPAQVQTAIINGASTGKITFASGHSGTPNRLLFTLFIGGLSASITGPAQVGHYATCTWNSTVTGGTAPYTYYWTISGTSGGYISLGSNTGPSVTGTGYYYGSYGSTGSTVLVLQVTDANGVTVTPYKQITLTSNYGSCSY